MNQNEKRLVLFKLNGNDHAVDIGAVQEILQAPEVLHVSEAPEFVDGVINLRNKTVPVVSLKKRLGLSMEDSQQLGCVMVVCHGKNLVGILVDEVSELVTIPVTSIESPVGLVTGVSKQFVMGMVHLDKRFALILDLAAVLSLHHKKGTEDCLETIDSTSRIQELKYEKQDLKSIEVQAEKAQIRKVISFELDNELYGADIENVGEILKMVRIMPLPNAAEFILGLINLRGDVVPVIDLRALFHLNKREFDEESRIIIVQGDEMRVGIVADQMWELLRLKADSFYPPPKDVGKIDEAYFKAVSEVNDRMLIVLDVNKILTETRR